MEDKMTYALCIIGGYDESYVKLKLSKEEYNFLNDICEKSQQIAIDDDCPYLELSTSERDIDMADTQYEAYLSTLDLDEESMDVESHLIL